MQCQTRETTRQCIGSRVGFPSFAFDAELPRLRSTRSGATPPTRRRTPAIRLPALCFGQIADRPEQTRVEVAREPGDPARTESSTGVVRIGVARVLAPRERVLVGVGEHRGAWDAQQGPRDPAVRGALRDSAQTLRPLPRRRRSRTVSAWSSAVCAVAICSVPSRSASRNSASRRRPARPLPARSGATGSTARRPRVPAVRRARWQTATTATRRSRARMLPSPSEPAPRKPWFTWAIAMRRHARSRSAWSAWESTTESTPPEHATVTERPASPSARSAAATARSSGSRLGERARVADEDLRSVCLLHPTSQPMRVAVPSGCSSRTLPRTTTCS